MSNKVGILILHGIGKQKTNYSSELQKGILNSIDDTNKQVIFHEVLYSQLFDDYARKRSQYLMDSSHPLQLVERFIRYMLIYFFSDATSYKDKNGYNATHEYLSSELAVFKQKLDADSPIIVATHSMGAMVISDYVYDEQKGMTGKTAIAKNLRAFITFACNIPLFEMGHSKTVSIEKPTDEFIWQNFFSPFDVLGYKVDDYYDEEYNHAGNRPQFIKDFKIFPGGLLKSWNVLSHTSYWECKDIHDAIGRII